MTHKVHLKFKSTGVGKAIQNKLVGSAPRKNIVNKEYSKGLGHRK